MILPFKDPKKRKEYQKKWEKANREKNNASRVILYKANPEKFRERQRKLVCRGSSQKYHLLLNCIRKTFHY